MPADDVQRSLGRIEGELKRLGEQVLGEMRNMRHDFDGHKKDDQANFEAIKSMLTAKTDAQDGRITNLKSDNDRARGAAWVILGILSLLSAGTITMLVSLIAGWVKVKWFGS